MESVEKVRVTFSSVLALLVLSCPITAWAQGDPTYADPPVNTPDWWVHPPDGQTRLQYYSFVNPPGSNIPPDYTENGYSPNVPDSYSWSADATFDNDVTAPTDPYGDNIAMELPTAGDSFTKVMGNIAMPDKAKDYFVEVVWEPVSDDPSSLTLDVTSPTGGVVPSGEGVDPDGWYVQWWTGTITPQPEYETFIITAPQPVYIDSLWIGTNCHPIPEPASLALLAVGGLGLMMRVRRSSK
jgi:hypothetical protein